MPEGRICVYCQARPVDPAWDPFCSERCKMADLGRWFAGHYRIAGDPLPAEDEDDDA